MNTATSEIDISVYILSYYHEKYIAEAIESVLKQKTHYSFEIVIADDCSKDGTRSIIEKYAEKYQEIIHPIFNEENIGIPKNIFQARSHCRGKYIVALAGDDYWIDDLKLEKQASFLEKNPEYIAVYNGIELRYDDEKVPYRIAPPSKDRGKKYTIKDYEKNRLLLSHGFMMRNLFLVPSERKYFKQAQLLSDKIDDMVDNVLVLNKGPVYILDDVMDAHRVVRTDKGNRHNFNSRYKRFEKNQYAISTLNNLDNYFNKDKIAINFKRRYIATLKAAEIDMFFSNSFFEYVKLFKTIPKHYRTPLYKNIFLVTVPYSVSFIISRIVSELRHIIKL